MTDAVAVEPRRHRVRIGRGQQVEVKSAAGAERHLRRVAGRLVELRNEEELLLAARAKLIVAGKAFGLTQRQAATALGLAEPTINKILREAGHLPEPTPRRKEADDVPAR